MFADTLEALGLKRGEYVIKVSTRKLLDGVLEGIHLSDVPENAHKRGAVLRALDKLDRLGPDGVRALLGKGRKDESGDMTQGAELEADQITKLMTFINVVGERPHSKFDPNDNQRIRMIEAWRTSVRNSPIGMQGIEELAAIESLVTSQKYDDVRVQFDGSIIRGLGYYTGTIFEAQLKFDVKNDKDKVVVFGSVGGGGRYDDLVARFTGQKTPAVGFSIGVSRLLTALQMRKAAVAEAKPLVVVTVFDKNDAAHAFAMVRELRAAQIRAEAYVGTGKLGDQFKYADKRGAALAIIEGPDEQAQGKVKIKDLALGAELSKSAETRADWIGSHQAETMVARSELVAKVRGLLSRGH